MVPQTWQWGWEEIRRSIWCPKKTYSHLEYISFSKYNRLYRHCVYTFFEQPVVVRTNGMRFLFKVMKMFYIDCVKDCTYP